MRYDVNATGRATSVSDEDQTALTLNAGEITNDPDSLPYSFPFSRFDAHNCTCHGFRYSLLASANACSRKQRFAEPVSDCAECNLLLYRRCNLSRLCWDAWNSKNDRDDIGRGRSCSIGCSSRSGRCRCRLLLLRLVRRGCWRSVSYEPGGQCRLQISLTSWQCRIHLRLRRFARLPRQG